MHEKPEAPTGPALVVSLDFELIWGVRDILTRDQYGANVLGARLAVPRMLEMFERHGIRCTWATVGFLFADGKEELMHYLPESDLRPTYNQRQLSSYSYLYEVGESEAADPYAFAPSLIAQIAKTPGQEIATHTMSHYYCLEAGQTGEMFRADLIAAKAIAGAQNIKFSSIVFPRNQYSDANLAICAEQGIRVYRGNARGVAYRPSPGSEQSAFRRAQRLVDAHTGMLGSQIRDIEFGPESVNVPAGMFLRPVAGHLAIAHPLHLRLIKAQMTQAAQQGKIFHLWWHPHNFGVNLDANLAALAKVIEYFGQLQQQFGMQSIAMGDAA